MKHQLLITLSFLLLFGTYTYAQERSIVRFGSDVHVALGEQVRDAVAIGGDVRVDGQVTNDAVAIGGSLQIGPQASVGGNAVTIGGQINQAQGAVIRGDIVEMSSPWRDIPRENWIRYFVGAQIIIFLGFVALALLVAAIFPHQVDSISEIVATDTWKSLLWGFLALLAIVPVMLLLVITILGIALIPVLFLLIILGFLLGYVSVANRVGILIFTAAQKKDTAMIWKVLIGLLILGLIGWVPVLGGLVGLVASVLGLGAVIEALIRTRNRHTQMRRSDSTTLPSQDSGSSAK